MVVGLVNKLQSMAKKDTPTNNNVNINNNNVNVHVTHPKKTKPKKETKPNWLLKAVIIGAITLISSIILVYVKNSTAANGKPAFIQNGSAPITKDKN